MNNQLTNTKTSENNSTLSDHTGNVKFKFQKKVREKSNTKIHAIFGLTIICRTEKGKLTERQEKKEVLGMKINLYPS